MATAQIEVSIDADEITYAMRNDSGFALSMWRSLLTGCEAGQMTDDLVDLLEGDLTKAQTLVMQKGAAKLKSAIDGFVEDLA